ncbi:MazG family protein [Actinocrinis puniceicyclus]|uniref:MazG family protein n=1 Tax=Actinocrinis puniceicyclus TaxID=977794 RepID=A0A8J7WLV5_9ACTN|nr:MazG family protein [Actinocrinis puniceicyclus]MBS2962502.1 MazG family protein [Actinocrinis puniceicyclus]
MPGRIVLVPFSPRVAPGLVSASAWRLMTGSGAVVHTGSPDHPVLPYLDDVDVQIVVFDPKASAHEIARDLIDQAEAGASVVWIAAQDGDEALAQALGEHLAHGGEIELELLPGSYDLPGAKVLDLVAVMDRLRSPGGCPWDGEQTHRSLVKYLLEEAYETVETIEEGACDEPGPGRDALREELGDVLLQVAFHARIAQEHPTDPFGIDDVADGIAKKLVGRHPHVFGGAVADTAADVEANWDRIKAEEKGRTSAVEGVPLAQPALSLADKLLKRSRNAGIPLELPALTAEAAAQAQDAAGVGRLLLAAVAHARSLGVDPEEALRGAARGLRDQIVARETSRDATVSG